MDTRPPKSDAPQLRRRSRGEKVFEKGCDFSKIPLDKRHKMCYNIRAVRTGTHWQNKMGGEPTAKCKTHRKDLL
jgi:hypothetical protein